MPEYTVHFESAAGTSVKVEANSPDEAMELAWDGLPGGVCAQCSGWGNPPGIDMSGDWEPIEVVDADGNTVWSEKADAD